MEKEFKIHKINYKKMSKLVKPIIGEPGFLPPGTWLPVSIAAHYSGCTPQTVRLLYFGGMIRGLQYEKGPLLVDSSYIPTLLKRTKLNE